MRHSAILVFANKQDLVSVVSPTHFHRPSFFPAYILDRASKGQGFTYAVW
jgi:hypothetical protein